MRSIRDLSNQRFGYFHVIEKDLTYKCSSWNCLCDCGNYKIVREVDLLNGYVKSCGCLHKNKAQTYVGKSFNRLTVESVFKQSNSSFCICVCECGKRKTIRASHLVNGAIKSCGCLATESMKKNRIVLKGKDHPKYKGVERLDNINRIVRELPESKAWILNVFTRDNYTCFFCKQRGGTLNCHHIKHLSTIITENGIESSEDARNCNELWDVSNGITLCEACHKKVHDKSNTFVWKPWGAEFWIALSPKYCYKRIFFKAGNRCSLQYHEKKLETIYVESGEGFFVGELPLLVNGEVNPMMEKGKQEYVTFNLTQYSLWTVPITAGDSFTIYPNTLHRIEAITDLTTLEVSTPEVDDCIRVQDDNNRSNGRIESEHGN